MHDEMTALETVFAWYGVAAGLVALLYLWIGMRSESRPAEEIEAEEAARQARRDAEGGIPSDFCLEVYEDHVHLVDEKAEKALERQGVHKCC